MFVGTKIEDEARARPDDRLPVDAKIMLPAKTSPPIDSSDIWHLVRGGRFEEALHHARCGSCDHFSRGQWIGQWWANGCAPLSLICAGLTQKGPPCLGNELVDALIHAGCPLDAVDSLGATALCHAAGMADARKVDALLKAGAHPDAPGAHDCPLVWALMGYNDDVDAVAWRLLRAGASLDGKVAGPGGEERMSARDCLANLGRLGARLISSFEEWKALQPATRDGREASAATPRL